MILVDSSVWIDHLRGSETRLAQLLDVSQVLVHPFIVGEIALGSLRDRRVVVADLTNLPQSVKARDEEVLDLIEKRMLFSRGLGYVDAHLLVSTLLTPGARLWSKDRKLNEVAAELGIDAASAMT